MGFLGEEQEMATEQHESDGREYNISIRVLGNEVLGFHLGTNSESNKWVGIGFLTLFSLMTLLGAYGEKLISLYRWLIG